MIPLWSVALAQEAEEPEEPAYEIIVYGELRVQQARDRVIERLEELGYDGDVIRLSDRVVYRHEAPWYGEVVLHDDGWMEVKRQTFRVEGREMPWARKDSPLAWAGCFVWPWLCVRISGALYSQRKWMGQESETVAVLQPSVQAWGDRIADLATERTVNTLPDRLEALWNEGVPLVPGPTLATHAERRAAILEFHASRTDTVWGEEVRLAVEAFVRGVVQQSEHPFTAEEIAAHAQAHPDRPLRLEAAAEEP